MAPFLGRAEAEAGQARTQNGSPEHWTAGLYIQDPHHNTGLVGTGVMG